MRTRNLCMVAGHSSLIFALAGCATSQDVAGVRQDLQRDLHETRVKSEQALAQSDVKRKASEELQARLAKDLKTQEQELTALSATVQELKTREQDLTTKVQELQTRHETLQKERAATQETNRTLRDSIVRALKADQLDLQQRLQRLGEQIKDFEQSDTTGTTPKPVLAPPGPAEPRQDKIPADGQALKGTEASKPTK